MRAQPNSGSELERLADTLGRLAGMDLEGLRRRWRARFGRAAPPALSRTLLYRALAYRIQADALGELNRGTIQALARLADDPDAVVPALPELRVMKPGTLLVREWAGALQTVMVMDAGFAWQGQSYDSLSAVARAITGTAWNGPRFFGLCKGPAVSVTKDKAGGLRVTPLPARSVSGRAGKAGPGTARPTTMAALPAGASA